MKRRNFIKIAVSGSLGILFGAFLFDKSSGNLGDYVEVDNWNSFEQTEDYINVGEPLINQIPDSNIYYVDVPDDEILDPTENYVISCGSEGCRYQKAIKRHSPKRISAVD